MNFTHVKQSLGFITIVVLLVFAILLCEVIWIRNAKNAAEELGARNLVQIQANDRQRAEIQGLKTNQTKISAMFMRLNDAIFNARTNETAKGQTGYRQGPRPTEPEARPAAIQLLTDAGVIVQPGRPVGGEPSLIFEAGSSRLELERLIALFAEAENSNAFLYVDRLFLSRPAATEPFSINPTYLDARFSIRVLSIR
jgi:hypothetical protein